MPDLQLVIALATPLSAVLVALLNYRSVAMAERWRTRRLLIKLCSEGTAGRNPLAAAEDETTEPLE
ncbi:hypothetical protein GCM10009541_49700 [Micromonospora gifhornensis]|uniref:Uncharacterized protein n=1 Tax=Micromonospora gifhornensis TaxID=84594 RepID=A0ABQ4IKQ7_9ACTN|nr:hypothetical protein [Micromonospora gifhornensis]GIJ18490.1 hypothetical protein Vgi01_51740 [Micromonospora gifhornensis]